MQINSGTRRDTLFNFKWTFTRFHLTFHHRNVTNVEKRPLSRRREKTFLKNFLNQATARRCLLTIKLRAIGRCDFLITRMRACVCVSRNIQNKFCPFWSPFERKRESQFKGRNWNNSALSPRTFRARKCDSARSLQVGQKVFTRLETLIPE